MWDFDPDMELEAHFSAQLEADMEMAEMAQQGAALHAAREAGRCVHSSAVGYRNPIVYPEQEGLEPGQLRCTDGCGQVFTSDEDWYAAMDEVLY